MKGLIKILGGIILVLIAAIIIGVVALKFYFTEDKIISLAKPRIEEATGRKVQIQGAEFSILKGFVLKGLVLKEKDGTTDFVSATEFSLSYDLMPLLQKEVKVSSISLIEPRVNIIRFRDGTFNYESLIPQEGKAKPEGAKKTSPTKKESAPGLGVAITLDKIIVQDARVTFKDLKEELPDAQADMDLNMKLNIDAQGNIGFSGDLDLAAKAILKELVAQVSGKTSFDPEKLNFKGDVSLNSSLLKVDAMAQDYIKVPRLVVNISSDTLDLDKILKDLKVLNETDGKSPGEEKGPESTASSKPSPPLPPILAQMEAKGEISIGTLIYSNMPIKGITANYLLKDGKFSLDKHIKDLAKGTLESKVNATIKDPSMPFNGSAAIKGSRIEELLKAISPKASQYINGVINTNLAFSGISQPQEAVKKALSINGDFALKDGVIRKNPISLALSRLLGLKELEEPRFKSIDGNLKLEKGWVIFKSIYNSDEFSVNVEKGRVSLDGDLSVPMVITLSKKLSQKLTAKQGALKAFLNEKGLAELPITLKGTYSRPLPTINMKKAKQQLIKGVIKGFFGN